VVVRARFAPDLSHTGKPPVNAYIKAFNGELRAEFAHRYSFPTLAKAQGIV